MRIFNSILKKLLVFLVFLYQGLLSPLLGGNKCRFTPSCSQYTIEAIEKHGPWKGIKLAIKRIGGCRPGGSSGFDPVP